MATHIGQTVYHAAAVPATNTKAGFEALTWVLVSGTASAPVFATTRGMVEVKDLQTGFVTNEKGNLTGVATSFAARELLADVGQIAVKLAASVSTQTSVKVVTGTGTDNAPVAGDAVEYAQGNVYDVVPNEKNDTTNVGFSVSFMQNAVTVVDVQPS